MASSQVIKYVGEFGETYFEVPLPWYVFTRDTKTGRILRSDDDRVRYSIIVDKKEGYVKLTSSVSFRIGGEGYSKIVEALNDGKKRVRKILRVLDIIAEKYEYPKKVKAKIEIASYTLQGGWVTKSDYHVEFINPQLVVIVDVSLRESNAVVSIFVSEKITDANVTRYAWKHLKHADTPTEFLKLFNSLDSYFMSRIQQGAQEVEPNLLFT